MQITIKIPDCGVPCCPQSIKESYNLQHSDITTISILWGAQEPGRSPHSRVALLQSIMALKHH